MAASSHTDITRHSTKSSASFFDFIFIETRLARSNECLKALKTSRDTPLFMSVHDSNMKSISTDCLDILVRDPTHKKAYQILDELLQLADLLTDNGINNVLVPLYNALTKIETPQAEKLLKKCKEAIKNNAMKYVKAWSKFSNPGFPGLGLCGIVSNYTTVLEVYPDDSKALMGRADTYRRSFHEAPIDSMKDCHIFTSTMQDYRAVLARDPKNSKIYAGIANILGDTYANCQKYLDEHWEFSNTSPKSNLLTNLLGRLDEFDRFIEMKKWVLNPLRECFDTLAVIQTKHAMNLREILAEEIITTIEKQPACASVSDMDHLLISMAALSHESQTVLLQRLEQVAAKKLESGTGNLLINIRQQQQRISQTGAASSSTVSSYSHARFHFSRSRSTQVKHDLPNAQASRFER